MTISEDITPGRCVCVCVCGGGGGGGGGEREALLGSIVIFRYD